MAAPKSGDAPACAGLSPSGAMERPLESSTDLKRLTFCFTPPGENEKRIWPEPTSEVPLASRCSHRPRFMHQKGGSRVHGAGAAL